MIGTETTCKHCATKIQYLYLEDEGKVWLHESPTFEDARKCATGHHVAKPDDVIDVMPKETLITLDQHESRELISFVKNRIM